MRSVRSKRHQEAPRGGLCICVVWIAIDGLDSALFPAPYSVALEPFITLYRAHRRRTEVEPDDEDRDFAQCMLVGATDFVRLDC